MCRGVRRYTDGPPRRVLGVLREAKVVVPADVAGNSCGHPFPSGDSHIAKQFVPVPLSREAIGSLPSRTYIL